MFQFVQKFVKRLMAVKRATARRYGHEPVPRFGAAVGAFANAPPAQGRTVPAQASLRILKGGRVILNMNDMIITD